MDESQRITAFLGLGGNLGDPLAAFRRTRQKLQDHPAIGECRSSPVYQTPPLGGPPDQADYLNAVLMLGTTLSPRALLVFCQTLETAEGRERKEHWGARTLDIDLLLYAEQRISTIDLELPHPRLTERHFVLLPLLDLAPKLRHPGSNLSIRELSSRLPLNKNIQIINRDW